MLTIIHNTSEKAMVDLYTYPYEVDTIISELEVVRTALDIPSYENYVNLDN